jgi:amino acid synthesis protein
MASEHIMTIRKTVTLVEEINSEYGAPVSPPLRRVAIAAVFENPLAGKAAGPDLQPLIDYSLELGASLTKAALATLGASPAQLRAYTKAALVGIGGDLEHGAAMIHPRLGMAIAGRSDAVASSFQATPRWAHRARPWISSTVLSTKVGTSMPSIRRRC